MYTIINVIHSVRYLTIYKISQYNELFSNKKDEPLQTKF